LFEDEQRRMNVRSAISALPSFGVDPAKIARVRERLEQLRIIRDAFESVGRIAELRGEPEPAFRAPPEEARSPGGRTLQTAGRGLADKLGRPLAEQIASIEASNLSEGDRQVMIAKAVERVLAPLDEKTRERFAYLAPFAPVPATFDAAAARAMWLDDPQPTLDRFVALGLLRAEQGGRYSISATLRQVAEAMLTD
jgi:hypothetical protein